MIHNIEYLKELMRKRFERTISPMESALLRAAHRMYDEGEWLRITADALAEIDRTHEGGLPKGRPLDLAAIRRRSDKKRRATKRTGTWARIAVAAMLLAVVGWGIKKYWDDHYGPLRLYGDCTVPAGAMVPGDDFRGTVAIGDAAPLMINADVWGHVETAGNLSIYRDTTGVVVISTNDENTQIEAVANTNIRVTTGKGEQLEVRLPDGTLIRMNEGTVLNYLPNTEGPQAAATRISGIAYVQVGQQRNDVRLVMETANSRIYTAQADFVIAAAEEKTGLTLLGGMLEVVSLREKKERSLRLPGDRLSIETGHALDGSLTDMMVAMHDDRAGDALQWARAIKEYREVPLAQFIRENERRFNIRFRDLSCLPKGKHVSAALCYRASVDDFFAVIENHGVLVYREDGQYTLCDPKTGKRWIRATATAQVVNRATCASCNQLN